MDRDSLPTLEVAVQKTLLGAPERLQPSLNELGKLLGKDHLGERWTERFTSLTLLFPALVLSGSHPSNLLLVELDRGDEQEVMLGIEPSVVQAACHAHALLVIAAFLDDRLVDRQVENRPERQDLVAFLRGRSWRVLDQTRAKAERFEDLLREAVERQDAQFDGRPEDDPRELETWVREVVAWRAFSGYVVIGSFLDAGSEFESAVRGCFSRLVLALQWLDDYDDLREDLVAGRDNLLVLLSRHGTAFLAPLCGDGDETHEAWAFGCPVHQRALSELLLAAGLARRIGLDELAGEIDIFRVEVSARVSPEKALSTRLQIALLSGR